MHFRLLLFFLIFSFSETLLASDYSSCFDETASSATCATRSQAQSALMASANYYKAKYNYTNQCEFSKSNPLAIKLRSVPCDWGGSDGFIVTRFWDSEGESNCSARPPIPSSQMDVDGAGRACVDGCYFEMSSMGAFGYNQSTGKMRGVAKSWSPTGASCSASSINPDIINLQPDPGEYCSPIGSKGAQSCVKDNGEHCIKFSDGGEHCWTPSFSGTEIVKDGDAWVGRERSPNHPSPPSQNGNQSMPDGSSSVVINNQTHNVSIGSFGAGGSSGGSNGGSNGSGGGSGNGSGQGNGEGNGTSAGGGSTCSDPPSCSGDAATCAVYRQVWLQRCDGHGELDGNAGGDFDLPPDIQAAMNGEGDDSWRSAEGDEIERKVITADSLLSKLDSSGFLGGASCPADKSISIGKTSINISFRVICDMLASASYLVMMLAYYLAIRIIAKTK